MTEGNKVVLYIYDYIHNNSSYLLKDLDKEVNNMYIIKDIHDKKDYTNDKNCINIIITSASRLQLSSYPEGEYFIVEHTSDKILMNYTLPNYTTYVIYYNFGGTLLPEASHNLKFLVDKIKKIASQINPSNNKNNEYVKIYEEAKKIGNDYYKLTDKLNKIRNIIKNNISDTEKIKQINNFL
jgi:hypothetical protein